MSNYTGRPFWFRIQQFKENPNDDRPLFVGYLEVWAIGYHFDDNTFRSTDIENVHFYYGNDNEGTDVRKWLHEMDPDKWQELTDAADEHYKNMLANVASAESGVNSVVD